MEHLNALPLIAIVASLFVLALALPVIPIRKKAGHRR